jgi:hypothetical protein
VSECFRVFTELHPGCIEAALSGLIGGVITSD